MTVVGAGDLLVTFTALNGYIPLSWQDLYLAECSIWPYVVF